MLVLSSEQDDNAVVSASRSLRLPLVFAHRGASAECPENTIDAFHRALQIGVAGIELDVRLAADGVPVVIHDVSLKRTHGREERVKELDSGTLGEQGVPSLLEVVTMCRNRCELLVELKGEDLLLAETVARLCGSFSNLRILSFAPQILASVAELAPDLPLVLNLEKPLPIADLAHAKLSVLSCNRTTANAKFLEEAHASGLQAWIFTCNKEQHFRQALALKVDAIFSDDPRLAKEWFSQR